MGSRSSASTRTPRLGQRSRCVAPLDSSTACDLTPLAAMLAAQEMKSEIVKYNQIIKEIKPAAERLDAKGNDTFSLLDFWRANETVIPSFAYVLRAVLANSPNSVPPERVFSILNDTFKEDQDSSLADYIELSLMLQYNKRSRMKFP